jgi:hypothetical protein
MIEVIHTRNSRPHSFNYVQPWLSRLQAYHESCFMILQRHLDWRTRRPCMRGPKACSVQAHLQYPPKACSASATPCMCVHVCFYSVWAYLKSRCVCLLEWAPGKRSLLFRSPERTLSPSFSLLPLAPTLFCPCMLAYYFPCLVPFFSVHTQIPRCSMRCTDVHANPSGCAGSFRAQRRHSPPAGRWKRGPS